ncbi:hypothetical protein C7401_115168 [Paraburkholderia unamae]|nr:hypothetical protein C7401_115168 [Paraburkholderia unamae]
MRYASIAPILALGAAIAVIAATAPTALGAGAATAPPTSEPNATYRPGTIATAGRPLWLRLQNGELTFCDTRGTRKLDLATGRDIALSQPCTSAVEPNTACSGVDPDVSVRALLSEPNDIVDIDGISVPLNGRVHDCAIGGKTLAVVTASSVVLISLGEGVVSKVSSSGGDRVAISPGWIAWSNAATLNWVQRKGHPFD